LNVQGGTQPEIFQGTVDAMVQDLRTDPATFWRKAFTEDGPIEIWDINGERWIYNGNHRYQASLQAGVDIPDSEVRCVDRKGAAILTWRFNQMIFLPGLK
jgi:hypothetical protein